MAPGAWRKFGAIIFETEVFRKQMHCIIEVLVTLLGLFGAPAAIRSPPQWFGAPIADSAPAELRPFASPRYAPGSAPSNLFYAPQIFLCPENFLLYVVHRNTKMIKTKILPL